MSIGPYDVIVNSSESKLRCDSGRISIEPKSKGVSAQIKSNEIYCAEWIVEGQICVLQLHTRANHFFAISGFAPSDQAPLFGYLEREFDVVPDVRETFVAGANCGELSFHEKAFNIANDGKLLMNLPYAKVSQTQAISTNELLIQFTPDPEATGETLEAVHLFIPSEHGTRNKAIMSEIQNRTDLTAGTENHLAEVRNVTFCKPRQRFDVSFCEDILYIHNDEVSHKVPYSHIKMVHELSIPKRKKNKEHEEYIDIALTKAVRQGNTSYQHLVISTEDDEEVDVDGIDSVTTMADVLIHALQKFGKANIISSEGFFQNMAGENGLPCQYKNTKGYLYMTKDAFFYLHSQVIYIPYNKVLFVEFQKYNDMLKQNRTFDLLVSDGKQKKYTFTAIDSFTGTDFDEELNVDTRNKLMNNYCVDGIKRIIRFIEEKNVRIEKVRDLKGKIKELENSSNSRNPMRSARKNEKIIISSDDDDSEEDGDFNPNAKESSSSSSEEEVVDETESDSGKNENNDDESDEDSD